MSNEPLGLYEELAANRAKYRWKEYIPPHDRIFKDAPEPKKVAAEPPPAPPSPPTKVRRIHCKTRTRGASNMHEGPTPDHRGRVSDVINVAADVWDVTVDELLTATRTKRVTRPRFAVMHFLFNVLRISLPSIGKALNRDHTTCLHAVRQAAHLRRSDKAFAGRSRLLARELRRMWSAL